MLSARTIRRSIGSAAVATAAAGITVLANAAIAVPIGAQATNEICEGVFVSGTLANTSFERCEPTSLPVFCGEPTTGLQPSIEVAAEVCVIG